MSQILDIMVTTELDLNYNAMWEAVYNKVGPQWNITVTGKRVKKITHTNDMTTACFFVYISTNQEYEYAHAYVNQAKQALQSQLDPSSTAQITVLFDENYAASIIEPPVQIPEIPLEPSIVHKC